MRVEFNRTGSERKALVTAISEILGTKAKYMGMPTTAYDFGGLIVDKTGALDFEENIFPKDIKELLQSLQSEVSPPKTARISNRAKKYPNSRKKRHRAKTWGLQWKFRLRK